MYPMKILAKWSSILRRFRLAAVVVVCGTGAVLRRRIIDTDDDARRAVGFCGAVDIPLSRPFSLLLYEKKEGGKVVKKKLPTLFLFHTF